MKGIMKRVLFSILMLAFILSAFGCTGNSDNAKKTEEIGTNVPENSEKNEIDRSKPITLTVFSTQGNYQGIQSGWFGKIIKDRFNIELNIIAPNVAGGGDTLYQTRSAEGNLGDIVIIDRAKMKDCVEAGIIMDITEYYNDSTYLKDFDLSVQATNEFIGTDRIYALSGGATSKATDPVFENQAPYVGTFMRLDYYNELGNPEMNNVSDMLKVLKRMQDAHPTTDDGKKVYAFSLFNGGGTFMDGQSNIGFVFRTATSVDPETGEKYSIADWTSILESTVTEFDKKYEETFGAKNAAEYLLNNNLVEVAPGCGYFAPTESTDLATARAQCGDLITNTSWQMVFAKDEQEFQALWSNMKEKLIGLGYEDVIAADQQKVEGLRKARAEAVAAESN